MTPEAVVAPGTTAAARSDAPTALMLARDLAMGGAERVFLHYASRMRAFRPVAVLRRREGALLSRLPAGTPLYDLATPARSARPVPTREPVGGQLAPTGVTPRSLTQLVQESVRLAAIARRERAGLVSSFLMRSHIVALIAKSFFARDLRVVLNVHEHMSGSAEHLYPSAVDRSLMRFVTQRMFPLADRIVVVAEGIGQDLIDTFGVPESRIAVVRNPLDLAQIRARSAEPVPELDLIGGSDGPLLVATGRLVRLKGFDVLIRAMARLPVSTGARLVIIGGGTERAALEALVGSLDLRRHVMLAGMQENPWRFMARATAVIVPSLTEAFPNVIGEALALGVPVIAADCSAGVREYLLGGRHGLLVSPGDADALAGAIERLLADSDLRARLAEGATRRMLPLDADAVARVYESVLAGTVSGTAA